MKKNVVVKMECYDNSVYFDMLRESDSDFVIYGNTRDFCGMSPDENLLKLVKRAIDFSGWASDIEDFMMSNDIPINGNRTAFYKALSSPLPVEYNVCSVLSLAKGGCWKWKTIRGCCQSDWQIIYYDSAKVSDDCIDYIEAVYFGTGIELGIIENVEDFDIDSFDSSDIDYYDYTDKYRNDDIAKWLGFDPAFCIFVTEEKRLVSTYSCSYSLG